MATAERAQHGDHARRDVRGGERRSTPLCALPLKLAADKAISKEAAAAAAAHTVLSRAASDQQADLDAALKASLAAIADGDAEDQGHRTRQGSRRRDSGVARQRRHDTPRRATVRPRSPASICRPSSRSARRTVRITPWVMEKGSQFRPGPPPALTRRPGPTTSTRSASWAAGTAPSAAPSRPTSAASGSSPARRPGIRSCASSWSARKLDLVDCARLFALVSLAASDAFIAVFDAKYHYNFWRPITAIRNADLTGNTATPREASWLPLGDTPMHPEYPCAHCISSTAVGDGAHASCSATKSRGLDDQPDRARRDAQVDAASGLHRRGRACAHRRRLPLPLLDKAGEGHGRKSASWPWRRSCAARRPRANPRDQNARAEPTLRTGFRAFYPRTSHTSTTPDTADAIPTRRSGPSAVSSTCAMAFFAAAGLAAKISPSITNTRPSATMKSVMR